MHVERSFATTLVVAPVSAVDGSTGSHETSGTFFCLSFEERRLHPLPSYHSHRPEIVTKTVMNCQTSITLGDDVICRLPPVGKPPEPERECNGTGGVSSLPYQILVNSTPKHGSTRGFAPCEVPKFCSHASPCNAATTVQDE
jgi:hypothetical protein